MIETALVFALGALSAGLLALVLFPAFTHRAARLAVREVEARLPRSLDEIAAQRDGVRAEYAARTARVEAALEEARQVGLAERLARAEATMAATALRRERDGLKQTIVEAEERLAATFADLRDREERLARVGAEKRDLDRRLADLAERARALEDRAIAAERLTGELRMALVAAEAHALAMTDVYVAETGIAPPPFEMPAALLPTRAGAPAFPLEPFLPIGAPEPRAEAETSPEPAERGEPMHVPGAEVLAAVARRLVSARQMLKSPGERPPPSETIRQPVAPAPALPVATEWSVLKPSDLVATPPAPADDPAEEPGIVAGYEPDDELISYEAIPTPPLPADQPEAVLVDEPEVAIDEPEPAAIEEPQPTRAPEPIAADAPAPIHEPEPIAAPPARRNGVRRLASSPVATLVDARRGQPAEEPPPAIPEPPAVIEREEPPPQAPAEPGSPVLAAAEEAELTAASWSFPPLAAPALKPADELPPDERDRRVEELAARLRTLKLRAASGARRPVETAAEPAHEETSTG